MPAPARNKTGACHADVSACRRCQRLVRHLNRQRQRYPNYHNAPVPAYGDSLAEFLIVGLAPGLHGANASGIPFTGDSSGDALFQQLQAFGFCKHSPSGTPRQQARGFRITNAVKCLPPDNLPTSREVNNCNRFLRHEIDSMPAGSLILALGVLAHKAVLKALDLTLSHYPFAHMAEHVLPDNRTLLDSYHCSRYNMNTGRLSEERFSAVFRRARQLLI